MENISVGKYRFFDDHNFPHGFKRSGVFTIKEAELLEAYGATLHNLEQFNIEPINDDEVHFQQAISTDLESTSFAVKTWRKYRQAISAKSQKIFLSEHSMPDHLTNDQD